MLNRIAVGRTSCAAATLMLIALCSNLALASNSWKVLPLTNHPSARINMAMAYDAAGKNIVLFGGDDGTSYLNDTWILNGSGWVQLHPPVSPSVRTASAMGFDRPTGKIVMFGGFNGAQYLGDTWIWDGVAQTWTEANPTSRPTPVTLPMLYTDPLNGHAGMIGGFDGNFYQNITWQWTGTNWKFRNPVTWLWARGAALVANDYGHRKVVIFGGLADVNPVNTWTWDGVNWTMENPATQPPWSYYTPGAYDPMLQGVVMFGGTSGLNLTWVWNGSDWGQLPTTNSFPSRDSHGLAYDYTTNHLFLFGGETSGTFVDSTGELTVQ
ncbi:MAG TPA: kelch repeat-containing protein [Candidatus Sulfotelmatobacter sp.]|nr:kelch repeat-containing protein [Candidatus Sulfotelmatobacter sp.]